MTTETTNARPTHRLFAVTKNGKKSFWQPIGALWAHKDGKGFGLKLDYQEWKQHIISATAIADIEVQKRHAEECAARAKAISGTLTGNDLAKAYDQLVADCGVTSYGADAKPNSR